MSSSVNLRLLPVIFLSFLLVEAAQGPYTCQRPDSKYATCEVVRYNAIESGWQHPKSILGMLTDRS